MLNQDIINQMKNNLKSGGVAVAVAPQLFPTPMDIAIEMAIDLELRENDRILEPSAGSGNLIKAIEHEVHNLKNLVAVEVYVNLCNRLKNSYSNIKIYSDDFLSLTTDRLGNFDKIIMNPPFEKQKDIDHVLHAFNFLKEGGILCAILSEGAFFRNNSKSKKFREFLSIQCAEVERLPEGAFKESGTLVRSRKIKIIKEGKCN